MEGGIDLSERTANPAGMSPKSFACLLVVLCVGTLSAADRPALTAYERSQGWRLLVDASDWRAYRGDKFPANWQAQDGSLLGQPGAALVSSDEIGDFELQFNWRVSLGGRGAVFFHIDEDEPQVEQSGPQMLLAGTGPTMGGNSFAEPDRRLTPQFDVWYHSKIVVYGQVVEHWINGERVQTYTLGSPDWRKLVAATGGKYGKEFGKLRTGRVALSGDRVEFRNVKLRPL
jgi:hypothetical protein